MQIEMLKAKLHHARVTECALEYEGSMTIARSLMDAVGILPYEKILVANLANGERFETYALADNENSDTICLNGATAHKGSEGDRLIIFTFCQIDAAAGPTHKPNVLILDERNRALDITPH